MRKIGKAMGVSEFSIKSELAKLRKLPEWQGKVPWIKQTPKTVVQESDRVGILDIEFFSLNFKANRGFILTYALKEFGGRRWYVGKVDPKDLRHGIEDKNLVKRLVLDLLQFDVIVGFFSSRCDLPWIRSRALHHEITFPFYGSLRQIDLWDFCKHNLSFDHTSLGNVTKLLNIAGKNHPDLEEWMRFAIYGDRKALWKIFDHNKKDVLITEKLYAKLLPYMSGSTANV